MLSIAEAYLRQYDTNAAAQLFRTLAKKAETSRNADLSCQYSQLASYCDVLTDPLRFPAQRSQVLLVEAILDDRIPPGAILFGFLSSEEIVVGENGSPAMSPTAGGPSPRSTRMAHSPAMGMMSSSPRNGTFFNNSNNKSNNQTSACSPTAGSSGISPFTPQSPCSPQGLGFAVALDPVHVNKAVKRLLLFVHPDKNDHPRAVEAVNRVQQLREKIESLMAEHSIAPPTSSPTTFREQDPSYSTPTTTDGSATESKSFAEFEKALRDFLAPPIHQQMKSVSNGFAQEEQQHGGSSSPASGPFPGGSGDRQEKQQPSPRYASPKAQTVKTAMEREASINLARLRSRKKLARTEPAGPGGKSASPKSMNGNTGIKSRKTQQAPAEPSPGKQFDSLLRSLRSGKQELCKLSCDLSADSIEKEQKVVRDEGETPSLDSGTGRGGGETSHQQQYTLREPTVGRTPVSMTGTPSSDRPELSQNAAAKPTLKKKEFHHGRPEKEKKTSSLALDMEELDSTLVVNNSITEAFQQFERGKGVDEEELELRGRTLSEALEEVSRQCSTDDMSNTTPSPIAKKETVTIRKIVSCGHLKPAPGSSPTRVQQRHEKVEDNTGEQFLPKLGGGNKKGSTIGDKTLDPEPDPRAIHANLRRGGEKEGRKDAPVPFSPGFTTVHRHNDSGEEQVVMVRVSSKPRMV